MLTPREKSPLPENFPRGGPNPRRCGQRAQTLPTSYSGPRPVCMNHASSNTRCPICVNHASTTRRQLRARKSASKFRTDGRTLHATQCTKCRLQCKFKSLLFLALRLAGLVVKASASETEDPGLESRLPRGFSGSSHTSDFKIGTPVATLPGAWHHRVSAGTGRPGVSIL